MNTNTKGGFGRMVGGESLFRVFFTNLSGTRADVALTPTFPSKIIPFDLSRSGPINLNPGMYMANIGDVKVTFKAVRNVGAACFGGNGLFLTHVTGTGTVFVNGGGTVMEKILAPGEPLVVDRKSLVGFADTCKYEVRFNPGCLNCCCSGAGMFFILITGPGLVITQSMSLPRLQTAIISKGGGSHSHSQQGGSSSG
jgi:uncharacterized protein (AIM24 family)